MIKVAHIMPTSYLSRFSAAGKDVGMALAHLVLADSQYRQNYDRSYKRYGFVILDNSVFEPGAAVDDTELIKAALLLQPDEIALPDVLFDVDQTLLRIKRFLAGHAQSVKGLLGHGAILANWHPSWQKQSFKEGYCGMGS